MLRHFIVVAVVWGIAQAERSNQRTSLPDSEATANLRRQSSGGRFRQQPFRSQFFRDESSFNPNFLRDSGSSFRPNFPMKGGPMMMAENFDESQFSFPMRQNLRSPMGFMPGEGLRSAAISGGNSMGMGMKEANLFAMPSSQFVPFRMPQNSVGNSFSFPVRSFPTTFFNMPFQAVAVTPFKVAADDEDDTKTLTSLKQAGTKGQGLKSAISDLPITSSSAFNPMFSGFPMQSPMMMMSPGMNMAAFNGGGDSLRSAAFNGGGDSLRSASGNGNRVPTKLKLVPEGALRHGPSSEGPGFNPNMPMRRPPQGFRPSGPEFDEGLRSAGMSDFRQEEFEAMHSQQRPFRRPEFPVRSAFPSSGFEEERFHGSEQQFHQPENFPMGFAPSRFPSQSLKAAPPMREEDMKNEPSMSGFTMVPIKSAPTSLKSAQSFSQNSGMKFRPIGMAPIQFTSSSGVSQENLKAALPSSGFDASSMSMDGFNMVPFMNTMAMPFRPIMLRPVKLVPSTKTAGVTKSASSSSSSVADDVKSSDKDDDDLEPMATKNHESTVVRTGDLEDFETSQFDSNEQPSERPTVTKSAPQKPHRHFHRPTSHSGQYVNKEEYPQSHQSYSSFYSASYPHGYKSSASSHSAIKNQQRGQNHYYIPQPQYEEGAAEQYSKQASDEQYSKQAATDQYSKQAAPSSGSSHGSAHGSSHGSSHGLSYSSSSHRQQPHPTSSSYVEMKMKPSHQKSASSKSEYESDQVPSYDSQYKSHYADDDDTRSHYKTRYSDDQSSHQKSTNDDTHTPQYRSRYASSSASQYKSRVDNEQSPQYGYSYYKSPANPEISYTDSYPQETAQAISTRSFDDTPDKETLEATS